MRRALGSAAGGSRAVLLVIASSACGGPGAQPVVFEMRTEGSRTAFLPDSMVAPAGSPVTIRLVNDGEIAHNFVLVARQESVQPIVIAAYQAIRTEYVPAGFEDDILASLPLAYPGDTLEVSFSMPEPGRYTYVCVFPGHGSTMRGTLVSEP